MAGVDNEDSGSDKNESNFEWKQVIARAKKALYTVISKKRKKGEEKGGKKKERNTPFVYAIPKGKRGERRRKQRPGGE